jgi:hypothetical protein
MQEMVSCCVAVSKKTNPSKPAIPKKQSACELRPNYFRPAGRNATGRIGLQYERMAYVTGTSVA